MHSDILNNYLNKDVEVRIKTGDTYEGNIKLFDEQKQIVILSPAENGRRYHRRHQYGETVLRQPDIIVVREILPQIEEDADDYGEEKMATSAKYSLFEDSDGAEEAQDSYLQPNFEDKQLLGMPAEKQDLRADIKALIDLEKRIDALQKKSST